ncbi:MAG: hypothetical protein J1F11_06480 [Oscillospiraceae bacterium]|nr:hypothetical protein [Oscillospiraceae bacterium]
MKQLTCEMCGSTDLLKQEGVFVCQTCGTKYSVEEAKRMMIEGTVEVTGTVKVDNANKIQNMLINAKRSFDDGKYSQAQDLYSQILNEDPNNAKAILYEGLSIGWQGNTVNYTMDNAGNAAKRALDIAYKQEENHQVFEMFVLETLTGISFLGTALFDLCMKKVRETNENFSAKTKALTQKLKDMESFDNDMIGRYGIGASNSNLRIRQVQQMQQQLKTDEANTKLTMLKYSKLGENTVSIVYDVFEKAVDMISDVSKYHAQTYDIIKTLISKYGDKFNGGALLTKINKMVTQLDGYYKKVAEIAIEKYWEEHAEEKQQLDAEKSAIMEEINQLKSQLEPFEREISDYRRKREKDVPSKAEKDTVLNEINRLRNEINGLGIFKGKEKKALQEQVNELNARISSINVAIENEEKEQIKVCNDKISEVEERMKPIKDDINKLQTRLAEIDYELTKDRSDEVPEDRSAETAEVSQN